MAKPAIGYRASGCTGRLTCEHLRAISRLPLPQQRRQPLRTGLAPGCEAFGHRELGVLRSFGLVMEPILTVRH
jgi:hypothetical protein